METVMLYGDRLEMEKWIAVVDGRFVVFWGWEGVGFLVLGIG
jgi:hypothetical protein